MRFDKPHQSRLPFRKFDNASTEHRMLYRRAGGMESTDVHIVSDRLGRRVHVLVT